MLTAQQKRDKLDLQVGDRVKLQPDQLLIQTGNRKNSTTVGVLTAIKHEYDVFKIKSWIDGLDDYVMLESELSGTVFITHLDHILGHYFHWGQEIFVSQNGFDWQRLPFVSYSPGAAQEYRAMYDNSQSLTGGYEYAKPERKQATFKFSFRWEKGGGFEDFSITESQYHKLHDLMREMIQSNDENGVE